MVCLVLSYETEIRPLVANFGGNYSKLQGLLLAFSTAYHPQTDGQSKTVNKCVENNLKCMVCGKPKEWVQWLPLTEYCYNTSFHHSTKITPSEAIYGFLPPYLPKCLELPRLQQ